MPKVVKEDLDTLNTVLTITIAKDDYEPKLKKELNKLKEKAAIKGFRKGKTPVSFLKKMYGKGLMGEIVTEMLQSELSEIMAGEDINYLGRPIPTKDHRQVDFDLTTLEDYTFKFDLGKAPVFELQGVNKETEYEMYKVEVKDEKVTERLDYLRKRRGKRSETEDTIAEEDMITFSAVELEGDQVKPDGWKTTFSTLLNQIGKEDVRNELKTKKKGDTVRFNVYELEAGTTPEYVKKHLLNFTEADLHEGTETGEMYEGTIESVTRLIPADLDQEFFNELFAENTVTTMEEANEKIKESLAKSYQGQVNSLLYRTFRQHILALNRENMPLPDEFIQRWLKVGHEKEVDKIMKDYDGFADDMRWNLIKNKLYRQYDFKVTDDEIRQLAFSRVAGYFGGYYQEDLLEPIVKRMMEDEEQVNALAGDVLTDKLFFALKEAVTIKEVSIAEEEFDKIYREVREEEERKAKAKEDVTDMEVVLDEEE
jgi:trigger factor